MTSAKEPNGGMPPSIDTSASIVNREDQFTTTTPSRTPEIATNEESTGSRSRISNLPKPLQSICRALYFIFTWVPPNCRWNPEQPPQFSMALNVLFAFAAGFTVANLYYSHPILNVLARDFNVPYEKASNIPTAMQAGYASGLLFLCPLGDLLRRRLFVIWLVFFTATMWIGLCITTSFSAFTGISFIVAVTTVTPQLMLPLVGDLAPPHRRAAALSLVVSGLMLGVLIGRVISGTITNFVSWRIVYWLSLGLQYFIFILLYLFMPDYPSSNPEGVNYFRLIWSILVMLTKHPVLVQSCLVALFSSATFTSFWTTLTFLLAGDPYHYNSLTIGLFGLIGIAGMLCGPFYARLVTDRFVPLFSVMVGQTACLVAIIIGTYTGTFTIAGPIIQALVADMGLQIAQVANRSAVYSIEPKARNRVNTAFMLAVFCGQLTGTSAGNHIYAAGGWIASGSTSVGFICLSLALCCARGPWEEGWYGWSGGFSMIKKNKDSADGKTSETMQYQVKGGDGVETVARDEEKGAVEKVMVEQEEQAGRPDDSKRSSEKSSARQSLDIRPVAPVG